MLATLDCLAELDPVQAGDFLLAKARELMLLNRLGDARQAVLALLETYPEYGAAQQLLLELHEPGQEVRHDET